MSPSKIDMVSKISAENYDRKLNRLYQEENLFSSRMNLFVIAESMLLISYITSLTLQDAHHWIAYATSLLGIIVSLSFLIVFFDQSRHIKDFRKDLKDSSSFDNKGGYISGYLGLLLPIIFLAVWFTFLLHVFGL